LPILGESARRRAPGHVEQATRHIHASRIQHLLAPGALLPPRLRVAAGLRVAARLPVAARTLLPVPPRPFASSLAVVSLRPLSPAVPARLPVAAPSPLRVYLPGLARSATRMRPQSACCPLCPRKRSRAGPSLHSWAGSAVYPGGPETTASPGGHALTPPLARCGEPTSQQDQDGEHHHAECETYNGDPAPETDQLRLMPLSHYLQGQAHDDENQAGHERHGARDRQGDDYPHPPGGSCFGAHCSTIASR
jgi:hypothetical protein